MKTDAEILALFGFMYTSIAFDNGKPVTNNGHYKVTPSEAVAIYRRAFRDGAEAAAVMCETAQRGIVEDSGDPRLTPTLRMEYLSHAGTLEKCASAIRRELLGTNQGAT